MQPCRACGGTDISAAGYCARCGAHQSGESYDLHAPASGPGYTPSAFPASAPPGGYDPASAPPYQGQPGYPPPGYPQQQGYPQQPGYPQQQQPAFQYQQPAPQRSRSFAAPLIALAGVAALLVVGIVVVVVVRSSGGGGGGGGGGENSAIDKCLVGTWRVTSSKQKVVDNNGAFDLTGSGWKMTNRADGTGEVDYGSNSRITGSFNGSTVEVRVTGKYTYRYATVNGTVTSSDLKVDGTVAYYVNGTQTTTAPLSIDNQPATYSCSGNKMTQSSSLYSVELQRQ